jgi:hypothetical protein
MPTQRTDQALTDPDTWPAWRPARAIVEDAAAGCGEPLAPGEALHLAALLVAELAAARDAAEHPAV